MTGSGRVARRGGTLKSCARVAPTVSEPIHSEPDRLAWVSFGTRFQFIFALIETSNLETLL
jgi:hypothetical protein